jgi:hypothetical protein
MRQENQPDNQMIVYNQSDIYKLSILIIIKKSMTNQYYRMVNDLCFPNAPAYIAYRPSQSSVTFSFWEL